MHRELKRLRARQRHPPVHELNPPIQRGWKRQYVLNHAARHQADALLLATILERLNTVRYFWHRCFRRGRRRRQRNMISIEQTLRVFSFEQWHWEPIPAEWRRCFRPEIVPRTLLDRAWRHRQSGPWNHPVLAKCRRGHVWAYVFRRPELFTLRVEKHWLTHYSEIEPEVIERIAEIERWMQRHHGHERVYRLKGGSWHAWDGPDKRQKCRAREATREMRAYLGFLGDAAADHIPSIQTVLGGTADGMWSAVVASAGDLFSFRGSEAGATSPPNTRHETRQSHRIPALRVRVVGLDTAWTNRLRIGSPRGTSVRTGCHRGVPPVSSDSPGSNERAGCLLRPAFSAKK